MANVRIILEDKLRETAAVGDVEGAQTLIARNVDINSKNLINGWTALHWASYRGNEEIVKILLDNGADTTIENTEGEKCTDICTNPNILSLLNGQADLGKLRTRHPDLFTMPTTALPAQSDDLILKVRIAGSTDPDFIEIEVPYWKLTFATLMKVCCEELGIEEGQVERIRKLPNTRLRKDSELKRLANFQCLEVVLKAPINNEKYCNSYQSISTHKDQTILY